ncbi:PREDICTED: inactive disease resistance protein RPS4-like [Camelina sativa]|uniref:Inactive disease resistance protein RPS4-like n=1 Tax=Camelina sativa TaxID=90675 RepID=A0ABM1RAL2_CAMSA|nr:PREDICTED: inactive disease resistance protein RPS4-like [Camelina sativa]
MDARNIERLNAECCTSLIKCSSIRQMDSLVYLNFRECKSLKSIPQGISLKSLKSLILSGCSKLRTFPIISENIESLYLDGTGIRRVPESVDSLQYLAVLNLKKCCSLTHLPSNLCKLKSLRELILSGCSNLECFPDIDEDMEYLEILLMDETAIKQIPRSMSMSNLKLFTFGGSKFRIQQVWKLYLTDCNIHKFPNNFSCLSSVHSLCLSRNDLEYLPESIKKLHHLKSLDLKHCRKLNSLPMLPSNLQYLDAHDCASLETVAKPMTHLVVAERVQSTFIFTDCFKLNQETQENIVAHAQLKSQILANACLKRNNKVQSQGLIYEPLVSVSFPGNDLPLWFRHQRMGSSIETHLPPHWCDNKFMGLSLCVVVSFKDCEDQSNRFSVICKCKFKSESGDCIRFICTLGGWTEPCGSCGHQSRKIVSDHVFLSYNNSFHVKKCREESNEHNRCCNTAASFKFFVSDDNKRKLGSCEVVKCGMSLLYAPDEIDYRLQETLENNLNEVISIKEANQHENGSGEAVLPKRRHSFLKDEEITNGKRIKEVNN